MPLFKTMGVPLPCIAHIRQYSTGDSSREDTRCVDEWVIGQSHEVLLERGGENGDLTCQKLCERERESYVYKHTRVHVKVHVM